MHSSRHCHSPVTSAFAEPTRDVLDVDSAALKQAPLKIVALGRELADLAMEVVDLLAVLRELPLA
jgi:hypothetical protein